MPELGHEGTFLWHADPPQCEGDSPARRYDPTVDILKAIIEWLGDWGALVLSLIALAVSIVAIRQKAYYNPKPRMSVEVLGKSNTMHYESGDDRFFSARVYGNIRNTGNGSAHDVRRWVDTPGIDPQESRLGELGPNGIVPFRFDDIEKNGQRETSAWVTWWQYPTRRKDPWRIDMEL